ncbi:MAG: thioredoxin-disulfide reductase [bacterium]
MVYKLIIIGSGPAGLSAAIYASRADLAPILFEGEVPGGPLVTTTAVENYPGFSEGVLGAELIAKMRAQAEKFGTKIKTGNVVAVDFSSRPLKIFVGDNKKEYQSEAVIISAGTEAKKLGLASEAVFAGRGVSYCATCDGPLFRGKRVAVVGGGDSALEEALFLAKFASEVSVLVRSEKIRASEIMEHRAKANAKIKWLLNMEVKEFLGDKKLEKIKLFNNKTKKDSELAVDGVFVAIGRTPNTRIFEGKLKMERGYIVNAPDKTATDIPGVFAAGDISDAHYRQAIVAAGRGAMAAIEAERYLGELEK